MRLYVIRHASVGVPAGTCYGWTDVPLASDWRSEGERSLSHVPARARREASLYASPLTRCVRLAELFDRPVQLDARLREMHFGDWEQQPWADLPRDLIDLWSADIANATPPGGENFATVNTRVLAFLDELLLANEGDEDAEAIIVTHGGPVRCLGARALGLPLEHALRLVFDYAGVACIELRADIRRVHFWNR